MAKLDEDSKVLIDDNCYELKNAEYNILKETYGDKEAQRLMALESEPSTILEDDVLEFLAELEELEE